MKKLVSLVLATIIFCASFCVASPAKADYTSYKQWILNNADYVFHDWGGDFFVLVNGNTGVEEYERSGKGAIGHLIDLSQLGGNDERYRSDCEKYGGEVGIASGDRGIMKDGNLEWFVCVFD